MKPKLHLYKIRRNIEILRKGGPHGKPVKAGRAKDKQDLRREIRKFGE